MAGLIFWYGGQLIKDRELTLTDLLKARTLLQQLWFHGWDHCMLLSRLSRCMPALARKGGWSPLHWPP